MTEIKRYSPTINDKPYKPYAYCEARFDGAFVSFADHAAIVSVLQEQVRALAAKVQAVRWASGEVYARGYNHGHLNTVDGMPYAKETYLIERGGEALHSYIDPDHCGVATDAIIREIRAQGVDGFVEFNRKLAKDYPTAMVAKSLEITELNGEQYAARIRAGEQP